MKIIIKNYKNEEFELSSEQLGITETEIIKKINEEYGEYSYYKPHDFKVSMITNDFETYLKIKSADGVYIIHHIKYNIPLYRTLIFGESDTDYTTFTEISVIGFDHDRLVHAIHSVYTPPQN
jgi:hypothetical protein